MTQTMPGFTVWFTGLPCSGKSTQVRLLAAELERRGWGVEVLDADIVCVS
jgi:adenylylsulfate kinase-like enzyme